MALDERQTSRLISALAEVDACLEEAMRCLDTVAHRSPFAPRADDVAPLQRQLITEDVDRLRAAMHAILARHHVAMPTPDTSAALACRTAIDRAVITVEALGPRYLRQEGDLPAESEAELNRIVSQLLDGLTAMEGHLAAGYAGDPAAHLAEADGATAGVRLLRELAQAVDAHHLTPLRAPLNALLERLEADDFEIAAFGRVNAGKSSLLNTLLEGEFLPVGALPATAVPIHIEYSPAPRGRVQFADAAPEIFDLGRLAEFAAEHYNPANGRHVTRLHLELPARRLEGAVKLVDMPGMAPDQPADFPRCDVGLVAIDASGSLSLDEAVLIETLRRAGSAVIVLLTKADRLTVGDRWQALGFVSRELQARTDVKFPVYLAATTGTDAALRNDWIERGLNACLRDRDKIRQASLRAKLRALEQAVDDALASRRAAAAVSPPSSAPSGTKLARAQALALVEAARARRFVAENEAARQAAALVAEVSGNAALLWCKMGDETTMDITTLVASSLAARCGGVAQEASRELLKLRAACSAALTAAGVLAHLDLPKPHGMPALAAGLHPAAPLLRRPGFAYLGQRWVARCWRKTLARAGLGEQVARLMAPYFEQVEAWRMRMLAELSSSLADENEASPPC